MKSYQINHHEIFMEESAFTNTQLLDAYQKLFDELLDFRTITNMKIFEAFNLSNHTISSKTLVTETLLRQKLLPEFVFLISRN